MSKLVIQNFVGACIFFVRAPSACKVVRSPLRFARKVHAAHLLNARMFGGQSAIDEVMAFIQASVLWTSGDCKIREIVAFETALLQQWVRGSCLSDAGHNQNFTLFLATVVRPCMRVSVSSIPANLEDTGAVVTVEMAHDARDRHAHVIL